MSKRYCIIFIDLKPLLLFMNTVTDHITLDLATNVTHIAHISHMTHIPTRSYFEKHGHTHDTHFETHHMFGLYYFKAEMSNIVI